MKAKRQRELVPTEWLRREKDARGVIELNLVAVCDAVAHHRSVATAEVCDPKVLADALYEMWSVADYATEATQLERLARSQESDHARERREYLRNRALNRWVDRPTTLNGRLAEAASLSTGELRQLLLDAAAALESLNKEVAR